MAVPLQRSVATTKTSARALLALFISQRGFRYTTCCDCLVTAIYKSRTVSGKNAHYRRAHTVFAARYVRNCKHPSRTLNATGLCCSRLFLQIETVGNIHWTMIKQHAADREQANKHVVHRRPREFSNSGTFNPEVIITWVNHISSTTTPPPYSVPRI